MACDHGTRRGAGTGRGAHAGLGGAGLIETSRTIAAMSWSQSKVEEPRGDAAIASWLGWLVPGAGHVYVGAPIVAAVAFFAVFGLLLLGIRLSDGMVYQFLDTDLRGAVAGALTPEAGNVAGLVYYMKMYGFGGPVPQPWPEYIHLGSWLMASSAMLNVVFAVHAASLARLSKSVAPRGFAPASHVLAGWLVPGLGHVLQGRRTRGVIVFLTLVGLLLLGSYLAQGSNLDRERHFYYWSGQFLAGGPVMILEALHGHALVTGEIEYADAGLVFACLAGLLNILCLLDVHAFGLRRLHEAAELEPAARAPAAEVAA
jgi:TM2 domain-containing membrane protein YozV